MIKYLLYIYLIIITISCSNLDGTQTFESNVYLTTQEEVNSFGSLGITEIEGHIIIGIDNQLYPTDDETLETNITSLEPLYNLNIITGFILINKTKIENLEGLNNIIQSRSITITNNPLLMDVEALDQTEKNDKSYFNLNISHNPILKKIPIFKNINNIGTFTISNNKSITNIQGLNHYSYIRKLSISNNENIKKINCFKNIQSLVISSNSSLEELTIIPEGKYSMTNLMLANCPLLQKIDLSQESASFFEISISNCKSINNLDFLKGIIYVNLCTISNNENLTNIYAILDFDYILQIYFHNNINLVDICPVKTLLDNNKLKLYSISKGGKYLLPDNFSDYCL